MSCYFLFSTLFISSFLFSSFPIVYSAITGGAGRDIMGARRRRSNVGQEGAGWREGEVEGRAAGLRRGTGAGRGLRRVGGGRSGDGNLDEQAAVADEEGERVSHGGGWATLLLSCFLLGFEIC